MSRRSIKTLIQQIVGSVPFQSIAKTVNLPNLPKFEVGSTIEDDRFQIEEVIHYSPSKAVYKAIDLFRNGSAVALKVTEVDGESTNPLLFDFIEGLENQEKIGISRHILRFHDIHVSNYHGADLLILSMDYAEGGNFQNWVKKHQGRKLLRETEGLEYFKHFCHGILSGIESGFIHRNVKPSNCLLCNGVGKVTDFCSINQKNRIDCEESDASKNSDDYSDYVYWSPEEIQNLSKSQFDERSIIYRLGVMLYQLFQKDCIPPYQGSYVDLREKHLSFPIPALPDSPDFIQHCVYCCLQKNPGSRYESVDLLLEELDQYSQEVHRTFLGEDSESTSIDDDRIDVLWNEIVTEVEAGHVQKGIQSCRNLLQICDSHSKATTLLNDLMHIYQQAERMYLSIQDGLGRRGLRELVDMLCVAKEICPDHPLAIPIEKLLLARSEQFKRSMLKALESRFAGDYSISRSHFNYAKRINPDIQ